MKIDVVLHKVHKYQLETVVVDSTCFLVLCIIYCLPFSHEHSSTSSIVGRLVASSWTMSWKICLKSSILAPYMF